MLPVIPQMTLRMYHNLRIFYMKHDFIPATYINTDNNKIDYNSFDINKIKGDNHLVDKPNDGDEEWVLENPVQFGKIKWEEYTSYDKTEQTVHVKRRYKFKDMWKGILDFDNPDRNRKFSRFMIYPVPT